MLTLAHPGGPLLPHDLAGAWNFDPLVLATVVAAGVLYHRGGSGVEPSPAPWFWVGLAIAVGAVVSPVDALGTVLASGHMVQHLVLMVIAAPLLAWGRAGERIFRGLGTSVRRRIGAARRRNRLTPARTRTLSAPIALASLHVVAVWIWHARALYDAALRSDVLHHLEHAAFLMSALWFWSSVVRALSSRHGLTPAVALPAVFVVMMANVLLAALMTFSTSPWYESYTSTAEMWGMTPLADQQLAGVLMWVPPTILYLGSVVALVFAATQDGRTVVGSRLRS